MTETYRERLEADIARAIADFTCGSVGYNTVLARAALQAIEQSGFWLAPVTPPKEMDEAVIFRGLMNTGKPIGQTLQKAGLDINVFWSCWNAARDFAARSSSRKG